MRETKNKKFLKWKKFYEHRTKNEILQIKKVLKLKNNNWKKNIKKNYMKKYNKKNIIKKIIIEKIIII